MKLRRWASLLLVASLVLFGQRADASRTPINASLEALASPLIETRLATSEPAAATGPAYELAELRALGQADDGECIELAVFVEPETHTRVLCIVQSPLGLDFVSVNDQGQVLWTVESKWGRNDRSHVIGQMGADSMVTLADWVHPGGARMQLGGLKSIAAAYVKKHDTLYGYSEATQQKGIAGAIVEQAAAQADKVYVAVLEDGSRVPITGPATWAGDLLTKSAQVRTEYLSEVRSLPVDTPKAIRSALKETGTCRVSPRFNT